MIIYKQMGYVAVRKAKEKRVRSCNDIFNSVHPIAFLLLRCSGLIINTFFWDN